MILDTEQLKLFKLIYETQSLSEAAKLYPMSVSKASRTLTKLRNVFGKELFFRSKLGLFPTEQANVLYPKVITVLKDVSSLQELDSFSPGNLKRTFVIGCLDVDIIAIFAPLLQELREIAPGVKIQFRNYNHDFYASLKRGDMDFVVHPITNVFVGYKKETLCEDSIVYCARNDSEFATRVRRGEILKEEELQKHLIVQPTVPIQSAENTYLAQFEGDVSTCPFPTKFFTPFFTSVVFFLRREDITVIPLQTAVRLTEYVPIEILGRPKTLPRYMHTMIWDEQRGNSDPAHQWLRSWIFAETLLNTVSVDDVPQLL